jgi:hypothetical protein
MGSGKRPCCRMRQGLLNAHCASLVWIAEQERIGKIESWEPGAQYDARFKGARRPETPALQDYFTVLATPISDGQKERYIRLRAWWAGNDPRRKIDNAEPLSGEEAANLRAFLPFLDESKENDRIMKAEAHRELAMFTEAKLLLSITFNDNLAEAAAIIQRLTEKRIAKVQEMSFD